MAAEAVANYMIEIKSRGLRYSAAQQRARPPGRCPHGAPTYPASVRDTCGTILISPANVSSCRFC